LPPCRTAARRARQSGPHTYPKWPPPDCGPRHRTWDIGHEVEKEYEGKSSRILSQGNGQTIFDQTEGDWGLGVAVQGEGPTLQFTMAERTKGIVACCGFPGATPRRRDHDKFRSGSGDRFGHFARRMAREYGWPDYLVKEKTVVPLSRSSEVLRWRIFRRADRQGPRAVKDGSCTCRRIRSGPSRWSCTGVAVTFLHSD